MDRLKLFFRRNILLFGFLAVVIPLAAFLRLQYWSMAELEKVSVVADKMTRKKYLMVVYDEVKKFYENKAEKVLQETPENLIQACLNKPEFCTIAGECLGVRRVFAVDFTREEGSQLAICNPYLRAMEDSFEGSEICTINSACGAWKDISEAGAKIGKPLLTSYSRDPKNYIFIKPIIDEENRVTGASGIIVDTDYFKKQYLPNLIEKTLPDFFSEDARNNIIIKVRDNRDNIVMASQEGNGQGEAMWYKMPFFEGWRVEIYNRTMTPEEWARRNFNINLSMSILMTLILTSGIFLALRAASREMRLSQMKTDFVSNVSHELRTPLSSIRVFGEFLKLGRVKEPEKICEYGEYIETESRRLTQLINNILDFSKIESLQKNYQFEKSSLEEIAAETLKAFDIRLKQEGFIIDFETPNMPLPKVVVDPDAIVQAFVNLLDNAIKYSGNSRRILVRLGQNDGSVTLSVVDQGIGIPAEDRLKIFDKFYRVSTGLVHDVKGSGLGLSIVKHIVEAHRGKVLVESEPGRGSAFTICLPPAADEKTKAEGGRTEKRTLEGGEAPILSR